MAGQVGTHRILRAFVDGRPEWLLARDGEAFLLPEGPFGTNLLLGRRVGAVEELALLAPAVPTKVIGIGRNCMAHASTGQVPAEPLLFGRRQRARRAA
jgi:hypothetical protein